MVDIAGIYASDPSMQAVQLGLDTQHFIEHDKVGKYLVERAHEDKIAAQEALVGVDPEDAKEIRRLQWAARVPDLFLTWLDEAISAGEAAEETIAAEEAAERY